MGRLRSRTAKRRACGLAALSLIASSFSAVFAATAAEAGVSRHTYTNSAGTREYVLFLPDRTGLIPLVVYLHGCGAPPFVPGLNEAAQARGFAVAYPVQALSANANGCWNWANSSHQHRDAGEPSILAGITREVMARHAIDPARVFISGHSAGSGMTANLVAAYPDLYAAAALLAGCGQLTCIDVTGSTAYREMGSRARAVPAYMLWGTADPTNPYWTGRLQLLQWLGMNDLADDGLPNLSVPRLPTSVASRPGEGGAPPYTVERYRTGQDCGTVDFTSMIGMGHIPDATWTPAFPAIIDFLLAHPMRPECLWLPAK